MSTGFTGTASVRVLEASDLKPTAFATRLPVLGATTLDTYVEVCIDDHVAGKTAVKQKSLCPKWNEGFTDEVSYFKPSCIFWSWIEFLARKLKIFNQ